jgi:hypothetical protein
LLFDYLAGAVATRRVPGYFVTTLQGLCHSRLFLHGIGRSIQWELLSRRFVPGTTINPLLRPEIATPAALTRPVGASCAADTKTGVGLGLSATAQG